jgi:general secretion pathway protein N
MTIRSFFSNISFNRKNIKYILIIIVVYLFFLIINLPANIALSVINLPESISLSSVSGTVWSGKSKKLSYSSIELGAVSWELHPFNLIIGELSVDISIVNDKQYITTQANVSPSGKIELEETRFLIDLSSLQPLTYGMPFSYAGIASGYFPVSFFHKNNYVGINGKLSLSDMNMISPQHQSFGDFVINFRTENEGATSGRIKDSGGQLNVDGHLSLSKNGQFNVSAMLAARESDSPLERALSFLGRKDSSGRYQLNYYFKLWN